MPKYTVPVTTPSDENSPYAYTAVIHLPINKEIADAVDVDEMVEIHMKASVKGKSNDQSAQDSDQYTLQIEVREVDVYGENEFENMAREDE